MPWAPGESGNPDGNKKQRRFLAAIDRALLAEDGKRLRAAAERLLDLAANGEPWAIKELADRLDGKPVQQISADPDGGPLAIVLAAYHPREQLTSGTDTAQLHAPSLPAPSTESAG